MFWNLNLAFALCLCIATVSYCQYTNSTNSVSYGATNSTSRATANSTVHATSTPYNASNYGAQYHNPFDTTLSPYAIVPPNPSLANFCSSSWESDRKVWDTTVATGGITEIYTTVYGNKYGDVWTTTASNGWEFPVVGTGSNPNYAASFVPTITAPCCLNCTLFGGNVQVYYWPTPAPLPNISTLVDDAGFSFISPSVYVAFQQLNATNLCGQVGSVYGSTTLAFAQNELSTGIAKQYAMEGDFMELIGSDFYTSTWSAFTYMDLERNCTYITTSVGALDWLTIAMDPVTDKSAVSTKGNSGGPKAWMTYSYNPCSPTLSVPSKIFSIDPAWRTCIAGISAFYDPPRALNPTNMFAPPPATAAVKHKPTSIPAQAAPPIVAPTPKPTKAPPTVDPSPKQHSVEPGPDPPKLVEAPHETQFNPANPLQWQQASDPAEPNLPDGPSGAHQNAKPSRVINSPIDSPEDPQQPKSPDSPKQSLPNDSPHQSEVLDPPVENPPNHGQGTPTLVTAQGAPVTPGAPERPVDPSIDVHNPASNIAQPTVAQVPHKDSGDALGDPIAAGVHAIPNTTPLGTVGHQTASIDSLGRLRIGNHVIASDAPAITIGNTPVSLGADGLIVGGSTTIPMSPYHYMAGSHTLSPGGSPVVVSDTTYSLPSQATAVVIQGTMHALPRPADKMPALSIGTAQITPDIHSAYIFAGQTLSPGGSAITVSGTSYSLPSQPTALIVDGKTSPIPNAQATSPPIPPLNIGGTPVSANAQSEYVISGETLSPGGSAVTLSGSTYSLPTHATALIINGKTSLIPDSQITAPPLPPLHIGQSLVSANAQSEYIISGKTLSPGGPAIAVSGTTYSLPPSPTALIINNTPFPFSLPPLTIHSTPISADSNGNYVLSGKTLHPGGPPITISDTTLSLASDDAFLVINGLTSTLSGNSWRSAGPGSLPPAETSSLALGAIIAGAFGTDETSGGSAGATTSMSDGGGSGGRNGTGSPAMFTAGAGRVKGAFGGWKWVWGAGLAVGVGWVV